MLAARRKEVNRPTVRVHPISVPVRCWRDEAAFVARALPSSGIRKRTACRLDTRVEGSARGSKLLTANRSGQIEALAARRNDGVQAESILDGDNQRGALHRLAVDDEDPLETRGEGLHPLQQPALIGMTA